MLNIKVKDCIFIKTTKKGFIPAVVKNIDKLNSEMKIGLICADIGLLIDFLRYKKICILFSL